jgi:serine/threonine protein kinase
LLIGSTISHYRIVEKLGEGGMGVVYKAEDTKLERTVALKFLAQHLLNDAEAKERFLREAKAAAALHHSNVCPVHEIDEVDGKTFLAMAFLEGESLEDRIAQGPLSIKDALDLARQVAEGLDAAHEKGIVHRDIKPANIMVDAKGHATIMDFGLARLTEASRLTKVDTAMGTVAYMSPEQAQGMEVDHRSDVWALGCVLYEMVSGQRPFLGQYDQALLYEIVHEEVAPLTSIRAGVPMELELLTAKCLEKEREDRYGSAQEVSRDLRKLGEKLRSGRSTILRTGQMTGAVPVTMTAAHTLNPAEALPPGAVIVQQSRPTHVAGHVGRCDASIPRCDGVSLHAVSPRGPRDTSAAFLVRSST